MFDIYFTIVMKIQLFSINIPKYTLQTIYSEIDDN